jgi:SNF2 family DNA or RNA helicase
MRRAAGCCSGGAAAPPPHERLRDDQREAFDWLVARERAGGDGAGGIYADDVGRGKTHVVAALVAEHPLWPTLIVAPKSLVWHWVSTLSEAQGLMAVAVARPGTARFSVHDRLVVASLSCFQGQAGAPPAIAARPWGRVVVDEAHLIRNPETRAHRELRGLRAAARWALTATPVNNTRADLLALAAFTGVRTEDAAWVRKDLTLLRANPAAAPTPVRVVDARVELPPSGRERELYERARAELAQHARAEPALSEVQAALAGQQRARRGMELLLRCMQACTHPALDLSSLARKAERAAGSDPAALAAAAALRAEAEALRDVGSARLDFVADDVAAHCLPPPGGGAAEKALLFCDWTEEMDLLQLALERRGVRAVRVEGRMAPFDRQSAVHALQQDPAVRAMVLQVTCGACGLNLQAASRVYLLRPAWNPAVEKQAIGRAHRSGQTRDVTVVRVVAAGTVDEARAARRRGKLRTITDVLQDPTMEAFLRDAGEPSPGAPCPPP